MSEMKGKVLSFLLCFFVACGIGDAYANWQYYDGYTGDGWYDDGARFVMSIRGGIALGIAKIKNDIGSLTSEYVWYDNRIYTASDFETECGSGCDGYLYAGYGELGSLPAKKKFKEISFAGGASIGFTMPYSPQWRIEAGWDHISETDYNTSPLFEGDIKLQNGAMGVPDVIPDVQSGGVQSTVTTDVFSLMAFYDFFDGVQKPLHQAIPYIGFGLGYADSKTVLNLSDLYGDLSDVVDLRNFGTVDDFGIVQFYKSEINTSNISAIGAIGFSYALGNMTYIDCGVRVAYLPRIKWGLSNADKTRNRDWFSAENMVYASAMLSLRFEF